MFDQQANIGEIDNLMKKFEEWEKKVEIKDFKIIYQNFLEYFEKSMDLKH